MITHNVQQGSEDWHALRKGYLTASEAPAALGVSKYQSRNGLMQQKKSGISKDVDANMQALFDRGHAAEATARNLAEKIIGDDLSPTTGTLEVDGLPLLASLDGVTLDGKIIFEHKLWNENLAAQVFACNLDPHYTIQMDQQLLVSGAEKCLFVTSDGTADNFSYCWYVSFPEKKAALLAGWRQFLNDMENFEPSEEVVKPKAEAIIALPSVFVQATGMVTASNLSEFKQAATEFIAKIKTELVTDQDFADAESVVKFCKEAESNLDAAKNSVTAQMSSVDEVLRTLDHIGAQLRDKRLMLDKLVKSEKEARKLALVKAAGDTYVAHVIALQPEIGGIQFMPLLPRQDFAAAIKGLKSLKSMQDALDTAVANAKIEADFVARDIRQKLDLMRTYSEFKFLFADLQQIITKDADDFRLMVTSRIAAHKQAEAQRLEDERLHMESEARAKAEREAAAKLAAEEARIRAEERAKAESDAKNVNHTALVEKQMRTLDAIEDEALAREEHSPSANMVEIASLVQQPSRGALIAAVQEVFGATYDQAHGWLTQAFGQEAT